MRALNPVVLMVLGVMLVSCTNFSAVTYTSVPMGAMLSYKDGSGNFGMAPIRREYPAAGDCLRIQGVVATWVSGAQAFSDDYLIFCGSPGAEFGITLQRPANYPGYDLDRSSAIEFGTLIQSGIGWQESATQMYRSMQASQPEGADTGMKPNCQSRQIGNQVFTNCD
jgi:hypothetical protein